MGPHSDLRRNGVVIRFDPNLLDQIEPELFDADWLRANQFWRSSTRGRSQAHFFQYAGLDLVLRHFCRGGLMGRVNRDLYLGLGAQRSRGLREFDLLREMRAEGLAVPRPVAARYVPMGPFYRADIITERIADAATLQDVLCDRTLSPDLWSAIGAAIRKLHDHGVFHSDLNCRNIMLDRSDRIWFIDFDKCEKRATGDWTQNNLDRLYRSLKKTAAGRDVFHWRKTDWAELLMGYGS